MFNLSPGKAGIASSVFPLGSMFSVVIGGFIFDKLKREIIKNQNIRILKISPQTLMVSRMR